VPTVITIHDAGALLHPGDFPREWRLYNRYVLPAVARRAQAIMTGTETARQDLVRHLGLREAQIVVAPYGVDDIYRRPVDPCRVAVWRKRLGDPPVLLFSGAPSPRKNLDAVLRILRDAAPGNALGQARLAISGASESAFPLYSRWLSERGLQDRVQWLGTVSRDDMPGLYAAVDALVYPSLYEGFGLPPLEAMSVGTPVIASRVSCLPEVLGDGALLVDPVNHRELGEAVRVVLEEPTVRHDILERGHKRAGQYTWESCAARTASVYRRIAGDA
jgi:glycosyltransferase involved in cell wall biosynthesis